MHAARRIALCWSSTLHTWHPVLSTPRRHPCRALLQCSRVGPAAAFELRGSPFAGLSPQASVTSRMLERSQQRHHPNRSHNTYVRYGGHCPQAHATGLTRHIAVWTCACAQRTASNTSPTQQSQHSASRHQARFNVKAKSSKTARSWTPAPHHASLMSTVTASPPHLRSDWATRGVRSVRDRVHTRISRAQ